MSNQRPDDNNDLLNFIAVTVETTRDQMVEMREQMAEVRDQMVEMRDQMATKSDLSRLESKMEVGFTAVRGDIEQVQLRVDSIDRALRARLENMETEISRLRSVLYLLVKDRPDMLRLLGQPPPSGEESRM